MRLVARKLTLGVVVVLSALGVGALPADASAPIKPHQHFSGLVNGSAATPVVYTACGGPVWEGRTGPVVGGQTMEVVRAVTGHGSTGLFRQVYAWFAQDSSGTPPRMLKVTEYRVPQAIPATVVVPCNGPGQAVFSSCPYGAPCAAGFVSDVVKVRFVNIAV
jgi:hypothetical protein